MRLRTLLTAAGLCSAALVSPALANGPGSMGAGGMMGGAGMLTIADDGSVLVTEMGMRGGPMGGFNELDRELISIAADGHERWRTSFSDGWPMMPTTDGNLVVLSLVDDWWMGAGSFGDRGWNHGSGMMHDGGDPPDDGESGHGTLVGLDLSTGDERWRLELDGDMISTPRFTEDGSRLYLTVRNMDRDFAGSDSIPQGHSPGSGRFMSTALVAVDRNGIVLWSLDLGDGQGGGPMGGGA